MVADVYEANKRYPEAKKILLMAYDRSSIGKGILYRLVEVSVKMKDFDEAIDFYNEFEAVARHDNSRRMSKECLFCRHFSGCRSFQRASKKEHPPLRFSPEKQVSPNYLYLILITF